MAPHRSHMMAVALVSATCNNPCAAQLYMRPRRLAARWPLGSLAMTEIAINRNEN